MGVSISEWFWQPYFWLPMNMTWDSFNNVDKNMVHPLPKDLLQCLPVVLLFLFIRPVTERMILTPLGLFMGVRDPKRRKFQKIPELELLLKSGKPDAKEIRGLSKQLDMDVREIEIYIRERSKQNKPSVVVKFCESGWRFMFYTYNTIFGAYCLLNSTWLRTEEDWFSDYPHHHIVEEIKWYYVISVSFCGALLITTFTDVRRKDFAQMFIHHTTTFFLLTFTWIVNYHRIGCVIMILLDVNDVFIESAKLCMYAKKESASNVLFVIFFISWVVTRLILFPIYGVWNSFTLVPDNLGPVPVIYCFQFLLLVFMALFIYWTWLICKVLVIVVKTKEVVDVRSDESSE